MAINIIAYPDVKSLGNTNFSRVDGVVMLTIKKYDENTSLEGVPLVIEDLSDEKWQPVLDAKAAKIIELQAEIDAMNLVKSDRDVWIAANPE